MTILKWLTYIALICAVYELYGIRKDLWEVCAILRHINVAVHKHGDVVFAEKVEDGDE